MSVRELETKILGQDVKFKYSEIWVGYVLVFLRVAMGWVLFQGGIVKVLDPTWSAEGFLMNAIPEGNPFTGFWTALAGNPLVDVLNAWGLTLTGLGLILGALVRWNAFWAALMMLFYWAASLEGGLLEGLPLAHGWVIDDHIVYALLLFGLGAFGAGRILGLDAYLENTQFVRNNHWLRVFLG